MSAANPKKQELKDYIRANYGACRLGAACTCHAVLGVSCPNWQPFDDAMEVMRSFGKGPWDTTS